MGCQPTPPLPGPQSMVVYRVKAGDIHTKEMIARIEMKTYSYMHSFSITENYVIVIAEPYYIDGTSLLTGGCAADAFYTDLSKQTTFYVVDLDTGNVRSLSTSGFVFIHTTNAWELGNDTIVMEVEGVSER